MKTRAEVENLKQQWLADGCWDIETTEGFEDYKDELLQFRLDTERKFAEKERQRIESLCRIYQINPTLLQYIENLESRIKRLSEDVEKLNEPDAGSWGKYQHFKKTHGGK